VTPPEVVELINWTERSPVEGRRWKELINLRRYGYQAMAMIADESARLRQVKLLKSNLHWEFGNLWWFVVALIPTGLILTVLLQTLVSSHMTRIYQYRGYDYSSYSSALGHHTKNLRFLVDFQAFMLL